jgi:hypothetical protein
MAPKPICKTSFQSRGLQNSQPPANAAQPTPLRSKKNKEGEEFHHHWRIGVHRYNGELYIKLPGGRVDGPLSGEKEELRLAIVEAANLPQMDVGADATVEERALGIGVTCDAFVTVTLGDQKRKTSVIRDTLNPFFGENFVFVLADHTDERAEITRRLSDLTTLRFEVRDWDDGGDTDFVGRVDLKMEELYERDSMGRFQYIDKWIDLCNEDGTPAKIRLVCQTML